MNILQMPVTFVAATPAACDVQTLGQNNLKSNVTTYKLAAQHSLDLDIPHSVTATAGKLCIQGQALLRQQQTNGPEPETQWTAR